MVQHSVVLKSDQYRNVYYQAVINYGNPDSTLEGENNGSRSDKGAGPP
jgi:hypothetical protein